MASRHEPQEPITRKSLTRMPEAWLERRTLGFQNATGRAGLPITWGTGVLRTDKAWKRDQKYLEEDK